MRGGAYTKQVDALQETFGWEPGCQSRGKAASRLGARLVEPRRQGARTSGPGSAHAGRRLRPVLLGMVLGIAVFANTAHAAQEVCTPQTPYNKCVRFTNSGAAQTFTVPAGVTSMSIKLWGAGGGGSSFGASGRGGGGAFASGTLAVTPAGALTVIVGSRGVAQSTTATYGGGGAGGLDSSTDPYDGASGGGRSAIQVGGVERITAGGGGGSSGATFNATTALAGGGDENAAWGTGGCVPGAAATRGTTSAGGSGGAGATSYTGGAGSAFTGGAGGRSTVRNTGAGGGGGGGYYGGGGGAGQSATGACTGVNTTSGQEGSGAGGSSYVGGVTTGATTAGAREVAANTGDVHYVAGTGRGGVSNTTTAGDGLVVLQYRTPTVQIRKQVLGGTGTFSFTGTNGYGSDSITVGTAGATVDGAVKVLDAADTTTVLTEAAPPAGYVFSSATCTGLTGGATPTVDLANRTVTLPAAGLAADASVVCTFVNRTPIIHLSKALNGSRLGANDQFTVAIRSGGPTGTVVNSPISSTTSGNGATVTSGTGVTGDFYTVPGQTYYLMETGSGSTDIANYKATLTCTDAAGVMPASALPNNEPFNTATGRAITPATGANLRCVITNSAGAPTITGRVFLDTGTGGGTANDGILNGSEGPQAGITVRLTNCASTVHATTVTDAAGGYSLAPPSGTASGTQLCVEQVNAGARVSTGASVGSTALPSGTATAVGGISYTYTRSSTPERIAFAWNGTGHADLNFGDVPNSSFAADGAKSGVPGSTVTYAHTFTAGTAGQVSFSIASSQSASPVLDGWTAQIFADPGCTGSLQPNATQLYPPTGSGAAIATDGQSCIVVRQFIPATAPQGASNKLVVQAAFTYANAAPALSAAYTLEDTTKVGSTALDLKKEVRNVTQNGVFAINNQAKPGETLEYRITYTNNANAPITSMTINDTTPGYTSFVSATAGTTPTTLSSCTKHTPANPSPAAAVSCAQAQTAGGTGAIEWIFVGSIAPGGSGSVLFRVKVD